MKKKSLWQTFNWIGRMPVNERDVAQRWTMFVFNRLRYSQKSKTLDGPGRQENWFKSPPGALVFIQHRFKINSTPGRQLTMEIQYPCVPPKIYVAVCIFALCVHLNSIVFIGWIETTDFNCRSIATHTIHTHAREQLTSVPQKKKKLFRRLLKTA